MTWFSDFERRLRIAPNILAERLDGFVADGLMERRDDQEYVLTEKGRELGPVIVALTEWGDRWVAPQGPPIPVRARGLRRTGPHPDRVRRMRTGARRRPRVT